MEYPNLEMRRYHSLDYITVTYTLCDITNQCLLDQWEIKSYLDEKEMKRDLTALGFNLNHLESFRIRTFK